MGGAEEFGRELGQDWKESKGHTKTLQGGRLLNLVETEDRARARQREIEDFTRSQERAILMEQALYLMEHDESFKNDVLRIAEKREVIDTEFA